MSARFLIPFHGGWAHRYCPGKLIPRHRPARHILRCRAFPLRSLYGCRVWHLRRSNLLVLDHHRYFTTRTMDPSTVLYHVRGGEPHILPPTLLRVARYTPTLLRLPRFYIWLKCRELLRQTNQDYWRYSFHRYYVGSVDHTGHRREDGQREGGVHPARPYRLTYL